MSRRNVRYFRFFWTTHKWTGLFLSVFFVVLATTGFLLLVKKRVAWIQPPTSEATAGGAQDFITSQRLFEIVFAYGDPRFATLADIERVDFRPRKRIFKVRSEHEHRELQVDAVTGEILSDAGRPSDLFEAIHDGSFFGGWVHDWVMPVVPLGILFLVGSGCFLWLEPKVRRRRRRRGRSRH